MWSAGLNLGRPCRQKALFYKTKYISQDDTTDCLTVQSGKRIIFHSNTSGYKPNNSTLVKEMETKSDLRSVFI